MVMPCQRQTTILVVMMNLASLGIRSTHLLFAPYPSGRITSFSLCLVHHEIDIARSSDSGR